jgi:hypothetical protein
MGDIFTSIQVGEKSAKLSLNVDLGKKCECCRRCIYRPKKVGNIKRFNRYHIKMKLKITDCDSDDVYCIEMFFISDYDDYMYIDYKKIKYIITNTFIHNVTPYAERHRHYHYKNEDLADNISKGLMDSIRKQIIHFISTNLLTGFNINEYNSDH